MDFKEKYTLKQNFYNALIDLGNVKTDKELELVFDNITEALTALKDVCNPREMRNLNETLKLTAIDFLNELL